MAFVIFGVVNTACLSRLQQMPSTPVLTVYPTALPTPSPLLWRDKPSYYNFNSPWKVDLYYDSNLWELLVRNQPGGNSQITHRTLANCILIRATGRELDSRQFRVEREVKKLGDVNFELNKVIRLKDNATVWINYCTKDEPQNAATCYQAESDNDMPRCQPQAEEVLATMQFVRYEGSGK